MGSSGPFSKESKPRKFLSDPKKKFKQAFDPSNLIPDIPDPGAPPAFPQPDSAEELARQQALAARIRRAMLTGTGRAGTIATSPLGVFGTGQRTRKTLSEAA